MSDSQTVQKKMSSQSAVATCQSYASSSSTSKTTYSVKSTTTSTKTTKGSSIKIRSDAHNFLDTTAQKLGIDMQQRLTQLESKADEDMRKLKQEMNIMSLEPQKADGGSQMVKVDEKTMKSYMDDTGQSLKFNLDVHDYQSESVSVKAIGNKIEVHAKKLSKKGDDEQKEEYSRTYELPSPVDAEKVTSSFFKDGVLTVELPMAALEGAPK